MSNSSSSTIPIIYIAGPVKTNEKSSIERNIIKGYNETRILLCSYNAFFVSPYLLDKPLFDMDLLEKYTVDQFMDYSYRMLSVCDALFALHNYEYSRGAKLEIDYAKKMPIPIFNDETKLSVYIRNFSSLPSEDANNRT